MSQRVNVPGNDFTFSYAAEISYPTVVLPHDMKANKIVLWEISLGIMESAL